jgi:hypothetical protein
MPVPPRWVSRPGSEARTSACLDQEAEPMVFPTLMNVLPMAQKIVPQ